MRDLVEKLNAMLNTAGIRLVTAESCTGGMIASEITAVPGSSAIFDRGFVTYSNESKADCLDVSADTIKKQGAVSKEVAQAMVAGALTNSKSHLGVSVTGIAGPTGGTEDKPVGTVFIGFGRANNIKVKKHYFDGDRHDVRQKTCEAALQHLIDFLEDQTASK